jgi:hypothetical protein
MDDRRGDGPTAGEAALAASAATGRGVVCVLTRRAEFGSEIGRLLSGGVWLVRAAREVDEALELSDADDPCAVVFDAASYAEMSLREANNLRTGFPGRIVACIPAGLPVVRAEQLAELGVVRQLAFPVDPSGFVAEIERLAAIRAHRKKLEDCERGIRDCTLRKPTRERGARRHRRLLIVVGLVLAAATAIAVPIIVSTLTAAKSSVEAGVDAAGGTLDAIQRMEGYLQRDEERKVRRTNP